MHDELLLAGCGIDAGIPSRGGEISRTVGGSDERSTVSRQQYSDKKDVALDGSGAVERESINGCVECDINGYGDRNANGAG
jgi:hypothetical protein